MIHNDNNAIRFAVYRLAGYDCTREGLSCQFESLDVVGVYEQGSGCVTALPAGKGTVEADSAAAVLAVIRSGVFVSSPESVHLVPARWDKSFGWRPERSSFAAGGNVAAPMNSVNAKQWALWGEQFEQLKDVQFVSIHDHRV